MPPIKTDFLGPQFEWVIRTLVDVGALDTSIVSSLPECNNPSPHRTPENRPLVCRAQSRLRHMSLESSFPPGLMFYNRIRLHP